MAVDGEQSVVEELPTEPTQNQEVDNVEVEVQETDDVDLDDDFDSTGEPANEDDDLDEIEHNGEKYKIPKTLKDAFLMQQDYTKKTQEVAESRKLFEQEQERFKANTEFQNAHLNEIVSLNQIGQQLAQFDNVNWQELIDADPVEAMKLDRTYRQLKDAYVQKQTNIQQAQQAFTLNTQQETARRIEQGRATLASEIKDWSPKVGEEVRNYLKGYSRVGVNDNVISEINSGVYGTLPIILARKAQLYDQLISKQAKPANKAPPPPVTKVGAKATVTKNPSQMTDREYAAWRQKQIKQRS